MRPVRALRRILLALLTLAAAVGPAARRRAVSAAARAGAGAGTARRALAGRHRHRRRALCRQLSAGPVRRRRRGPSSSARATPGACSSAATSASTAATSSPGARRRRSTTTCARPRSPTRTRRRGSRASIATARAASPANLDRYVGWMQYAAALGNAEASYELAVYYRKAVPAGARRALRGAGRGARLQGAAGARPRPQVTRARAAGP